MPVLAVICIMHQLYLWTVTRLSIELFVIVLGRNNTAIFYPLKLKRRLTRDSKRVIISLSVPFRICSVLLKTRFVHYEIQFARDNVLGWVLTKNNANKTLKVQLSSKRWRSWLEKYIMILRLEKLSTNRSVWPSICIKLRIYPTVW